VNKFSKFLWGDIFYNFETRKFSKKNNNMEAPRSFVHFILEPFYKIISLTLTKDKDELIRIMKSDLGGI
jgi:116 kDa U5 small nuclear ribonucleoprotein component